MIRKYFLLLIILRCFASCNDNDKSNFSSINKEKSENIIIKKGIKLELCYPLDSIKELWINNWKGKHKLSNDQKDTIINVFKNAKLHGYGASIKPGHLNFSFLFKNGQTDECYGSNNILIFEGGIFNMQNKTNGEFHLDKDFNFDNY